MDSSIALENWRPRTCQALKWLRELPVPRKLVLALAFACVTGIAAQIRFPLPFTVVPITGQVFAVLLSGVVLGQLYGGVSQLLYLAVGVAGVPWFAPGSAGLFGPTGGYLIGFIPAAALIGWLTDRRIRFRTIGGQALLMMSAVGIVYLFGAIHFALWTQAGLSKTLMAAVLPFIPVDLAKALAVAALTSTLLPRKPYGNECDVRAADTAA